MILHKRCRRKIVGAVFDVGRVTWFQRGLLNEDFSLVVSAQKLKEERVRAIVGKSFSVPVWFSTSGLVPYCFAQILQEKEGVAEKKGRMVRTTPNFDVCCPTKR